MAIMMVLILLVPALVGVKCYEKFRGRMLELRPRIELYLIFAFIINLCVYGVFWVRKWEYIAWGISGETSLHIITFVVQYMVMSLVLSVVLAYILSLVRIGKSTEEDEEDI